MSYGEVNKNFHKTAMCVYMILKSKQSILLDNWFQVHQFHRTGLASHKYYKHKQNWISFS